MRRYRLTYPLSAVLLFALLAGPAAAHDFTGSEEQEETLPCPKQGQQIPRNQEPPGPGECDELEEKTYRGYVWDNDVKCASGGTDAGVAKVYTTSDPSKVAGGTGVCNDGSAVPVQGRVVLKASRDNGVTAYADGDKDNSNATAQGWARADADTSGAAVRCGQDGGKRDATHPENGDTQANCG